MDNSFNEIMKDRDEQIAENKITMEELKNKIEKKDMLELELQTKLYYLNEGQGKEFGLTKSLVDEEGFPHHDVDIVLGVRKARHDIACLKTDLKTLMTEIEDGLNYIHTEKRVNNQIKSSTTTKGIILIEIQNQNHSKYDFELEIGIHSSILVLKDKISSQQNIQSYLQQTLIFSNQELHDEKRLSDYHINIGDKIQCKLTPIKQIQNLKPFAVFDQIVPESPAALGGLQENDLLLQFGSISLNQNPNPFKDIPSLVSENKGKPVQLYVNRKNVVESLSITPDNWSGNGLLGCHLVPM